ncbi:cadmium resistance transporter [Gloeothece verrucosa]|uniref:Cadmium resistance transporter n=1 Tax=Gloeothece verrucosa (strain PCC 7822) TaxID=497965 RepID=E0U735_GLOV7|nr:cadmium resistance transporter [Gloeothece verrucosa]ADN17191.1 cadmium resistance transporter [Gloeothece verrucosa PCC 7822]
MTNIITAIATGITAFSATNLDDILILMLFFSQAKSLFSRRQIVIGQYLGVMALVLVSLTGFFGGLLLPESWIGLLGLAPIAIGINRLLNGDNDESEEKPTLSQPKRHSAWGNFLSPQTYGVAAVTLANGGDNVGIYVPLFAHCTPQNLLIILSVFFCLIGVWCYVAYGLTRVPVIADNLTRYGNYLVPFVLIGLGLTILIESHTLENPALIILTLIVSSMSLIMLNCNSDQTLEV